MTEHPIPRKLAEIWEVHGGYHLRVEVPAGPRSTDPYRAVEAALQAMAEILAAGKAEVFREDPPPSDARRN
jgi:hypothetical protein